ncbi:MAG TPA: antitoxin Xre/MbcA/ParS toxin-binding domain-containing protein [Longimicrobium sp.]|jgi:hypothetical protein
MEESGRWARAACDWSTWARYERPIDLARTDLGAREVEELLMRIEYALPV